MNFGHHCLGNRQLRARDVARRKARGERGVRGAKGGWAPRNPYVKKKNLARVRVAFAGATRGAEVHRACGPLARRARGDTAPIVARQREKIWSSVRRKSGFMGRERGPPRKTPKP